MAQNNPPPPLSISPASPIVIGLTGGIGSGKSTVSQRLLDRYQIPTIDTDVIARSVVMPNTAGLNAVVQAFGNSILNTDGTLNRKKLRDIIFNNAQDKKQLEAILHPLIQNKVKEELAQIKQKNPPPLILVAIPLLTESIQKTGQKPHYLDYIWVIDATNEQQIKHASQRDHATPQQIQKIIDQQASRAERLAIADAVIDNTGNLDDLQQQLNALIAPLLPTAHSAKILK
ncbi:MAG: dephospho-CoA kinase [Thiomicrorhabdus sp.]|nr:dephospho-CoA kinase [Thiomicrorhabdus sp.]